MKLGFTGRIARASARRPWLTLTAWAVALAAAVAAAGSLGDVVTQDERMLIPADSQQVMDLEEQHRSEGDSATVTETIIIRSELARFGETEFANVIADLEASIGAVPGVTSVSAPSAAQPFPVSADGDTALMTVELLPGDDNAGVHDVIHAAESVTAAGFSAASFGDTSGGIMFDEVAEETLIRGEVIGISIAVLILVVVFGALAAAGIPLMVALVSIVTAVGATAVVGRAFELSFFVLNMITMMGLALGIDYTLVMVQRFREELAKGASVAQAVGIAGNTANRAVFFSGLTVLISLVGLLIVPSTIMRSLGAGAMIVAVTAVAASLTLLPAVLGLLGHRVNKGRIPTAHPGAEPRTWTRIATVVIARPAIAATLGVAVLAAMALPLASMRLTFPGLESLPEDNQFRQSAHVLAEDFGLGQATTTIVVQDAVGAETEVDALAAAVEEDPAFAETTVEWVDGVAFIDTKDVFDAADARAEDAVERLRDEVVPAAFASTDSTVLVGGGQAGSIDFTQMIFDYAPLVLAIVLGASFVLLLVTFRSVVIPLVAIALNLLSAAAAFGLLVAAFQYGWGADLLGLPQVDGIAPWIPLFLFAVLFGLSMDYHVFLLSRVKEHYDATGNTRDAVVFGLSRTGSLITGAALIMVAVFSGFALGDLAEFAQMGFGLAAAIIIDATIVRTVLVPSIMALLGRANWYLPRSLSWLPTMHIEGPPEPAPEGDTPREREPALV